MLPGTETLLRPALIMALLLPLAACTGGPQQPSDAVDDRSTEALRSDADGTAPAVEDALDSASSPDADVPAETTAIDAAALTEPDLSSIAGRWAYALEDCDAQAEPALTITATRFEGADRQCDIVSTIDRGDGGVTATLSCQSATSAAMTTELVTAVPGDGDTLSVSVVGTEAAAQTYARCP
jgi:hypothetical protein